MFGNTKAINLKFDTKSTMIAASFEDNSVAIMDPVGNTPDNFIITKERKLEYPITSFAWKPGKAYVLGSCINGSVVCWANRERNED